jgi:glycosyltransferase involved in cell wall biosynthesis
LRVLVLPVYNEEIAIKELILEFLSSHTELTVIAVNDCSNDSTGKILESISDIRLIIVHNEKNLGHGLSVIKGLSYALNIGAKVVITADGDGNYFVKDVLRLISTLEKNNLQVVEGIRIARNDPWFRRISSFVTRLLVRIRSKHRTKDANTPFHAFRSETLSEILHLIPESGKIIPNIYISSLIRSKSIAFHSIDIAENYRKGSNPLGVTWNQKNRNIPSKRYISFCFRALYDWFVKR